jgi:hypothetical protein
MQAQLRKYLQQLKSLPESSLELEMPSKCRVVPEINARCYTPHFHRAPGKHGAQRNEPACICFPNMKSLNRNKLKYASTPLNLLPAHVTATQRRLMIDSSSGGGDGPCGRAEGQRGVDGVDETAAGRQERGTTELTR